ncbi:PREDICTED: protein jagged-2-like isoform X3 [Acropora digitifera]|uniref:protein jagged-2-like isoform X3 n=1 Tax=Acropora digitifera TaxID=70779 RepID=UPI00077A01E9|nr:PREDICTED: protein jagged-2-like isoform X3 [Acropora digitifera]
MFASLLFCFNLNVLTTIVFASMSQDFCGRVFNTWVGHALVGHSMSSVLVGDELECQLKCIHTQPCKSFNVHFSSNQANKHVCELNNQTREMKPSDFKARKGSNYYGPVQVSCVDVSRECTGKQNINESNQNSCKNGGTWIVKDGKHQCHCPRNFTGSSCEIHTNECNHSLCENGGTCKLKDGKHNCHCPRNFTGSSCEIHAQEIGCFTDKFYDRALLFLESYRGRIPWNNLWKVVRDCSKAAKKLKYYYFAIQGYGDCWAGLANQTYDKHGHSDNCHSRPGLGGQLTNFVYKFTDV